MKHSLSITVPDELRIGASWRPAEDGGTFAVADPATELVIAEVANGTEQDAHDAVDAAAAALPDWAATAPRFRSEILRRSFELMIEKSDDLASLIVAENGKALAGARSEVAYAAGFFRWYAEEAARALGTVQMAPSGANSIMVQHQAVGVCILVTPWNFPAAMATRKIAPALAAGCTVVLKPASETPLTALAMVQILIEAGVPDGVVNVLPSTRSGAVVQTMLADDRVRKMSFTGSTEVGRVLLAEAARSVVNCSMELGGNAPFLIFSDADLDEAVAGAMVAKMRNGGEACTAANRFYVEESVAGEFARLRAESMAAMSVGPGSDAANDVGPLVNQSSRDKVASLVSDSVEAGATLVTGGVVPSGPGWFYPPTVLTDVPDGAPVMREEIFGPVAPIATFSSEEEAIAKANDTEYGLVAYVYTQDLARGIRVAEALEVGMVGLNRGVVSDPVAPFGGQKQSGVGREGGHDGLLDYMETKYIVLRW